MRLSDVQRLLAPLRTRVANLVARAVVQLVADGGGLQVVQLGVLEGETRDGCERVQSYGFTSHPHPGAEAVVLFVGGRRDHGLVLAVDDRRHRKRPLAEGEVALYTDEGDSIVLRRGRIVEVVAGTRLRVEAPLVEVTGDLQVGGNVVASGEVSDATGSMTEMRTAYNAHTHPTAPTGPVSTPSTPMA